VQQKNIKKDRSFRALTEIAVLLKICPKNFFDKAKNKEPRLKIPILSNSPKWHIKFF
jgi:hypothetical protein